MNPFWLSSIKFLSILLYISIILSFSNPAIVAHLRVTGFGFTIKQKSSFLFNFNVSNVTTESFPPPIGAI